MYGAGDGNRTHAASLEGWNSTIELHPHENCPNIIPQCLSLVKGFCEIFLFFFVVFVVIPKDGGQLIELVDGPLVRIHLLIQIYSAEIFLSQLLVAGNKTFLSFIAFIVSKFPPVKRSAEEIIFS